jgi:hypothetical protein
MEFCENEKKTLIQKKQKKTKKTNYKLEMVEPRAGN